MLLNTSRPIPLLERFPSSRQAKLALRGTEKFAFSLDPAKFFISLMIETMEVTQNAVRNEERKKEYSGRPRDISDRLSPFHHTYVQDYLIIFELTRDELARKDLL